MASDYAATVEDLLLLQPGPVLRLGCKRHMTDGTFVSVRREDKTIVVQCTTCNAVVVVIKPGVVS